MWPCAVIVCDALRSGSWSWLRALCGLSSCSFGSLLHSARERLLNKPDEHLWLQWTGVFFFSNERVLMPFLVIWLHKGVKSQPCKLSVKVWLWKSVAALLLEHLIWLESRLTPPRDHKPGLWDEQGIYTNGFHLHVSLLSPPFHPLPPCLSFLCLL